MHETTPRRHHGDTDALGARLDFAVNVRASAPGPELLAALTQELHTLGSYPNAQRNHAAHQLIANWLSVPAERTMLTAGAAEGFSLLGALNPTHAFIIHPGFSEPEDTLADQQVPLTKVVLPAPYTQNLLHDSLTQAVHTTPTANLSRPLVIIGNPANPTGCTVDPTTLVDTITRIIPHAITVIDEAFADVATTITTALPLAATRNDVVVLRSLTKTFALAGLRCGILIADTTLLAPMAARRPHWPLSSLQLAAFEWVAHHHTANDFHHIATEIATQRDYLINALAPFDIHPATHSHAPYVLLKLPWDATTARHIRIAMKQRGVAIRRCDTFPGLDETWWRLAVRPQDSVDDFCHQLAACLTQLPAA
ncbi:aminotransferase class I/II-fold pyridoxal phosphate-dependent enzyme [Corynebacterium aquilae]|uniref:Aminotransferase class I/classII large domain-containing protein n=1 Tax=Corynebacterium aquilae DSM 44791 TaxID=1431546 RepID=A0A1L7CH57_9CORY|nr:aminotransferase class I/II-fold pyridoxal phosphate-dependent enzyme [Corynebacterium aquilae]APT85155.1 hypothetical protein CAQU_08805 [Corynebacterium aquilae DSM 44791]